MPPQVFVDLVFSYRAVGEAIMKRLAAEVRRQANRVGELTLLSVRHRLCAELVRSARPDGNGGGLITPPPLHKDLAARISTAREVVTRELRQLERAGLIEARRGALALMSLSALSNEHSKAF
jgi:CRP-like cAMP-binding protein